MALENALPILGICRVHQLLNIALGGTLYQDLAMQLPDTLDHAYAPATPWNTTYTL
jgi:putative glutamine amidotransferase